MSTRKSGILGFVIFLGFSCFPQFSQANDLQLSNVRLGPRDTGAKTLAVLFDVSWKNSWRNKINHDAAWLTVRLQDAGVSSEEKLCQMAFSGLNPSGAAHGSNSDLEILVPSDKTGAFLRRASSHSSADVSTTSAMLTVNYDSCGFSGTSDVSATVIGLEMVFVPQGAFFAGDNAASAAAFRRGASDNSPWPVTSEAAINVTAAATNGFYYVSAGDPSETPSGSSFVIPASFPKGFGPFYIMKYELTEGQWVEFVNSLAPAARTRRDVTNASHKNSDTVLSRNTLACSGAPVVCTSENPSRAMTFLSWPDLCAYLDWAGLRPMTELEFEKAARGPFVPVSGEYAWGSTTIVPAAAISGTSEDGTETVVTTGANARYNNVSLSGGDSAKGPDYQLGPLRAGIFSTGSSDRVLAGAGDFGALELSGNVKEWVVSVGNPAGLLYAGTNGDGVLATAPGFEGNATSASWPGMDADVTHGVVSSAGAGFRGGSWADAAARLAVSDRTEASAGASDAASTYGGRGVRSVEGP